MSKRYFYGRRQADLFSFVRMPKLLFTEDVYDKLSLQAKVLYGFLLDRMSLSAENGWFDDEGRVYVYYTVAEIEKNFKCGNKKACSFLQELEDFELIEKKRQGLNKPNLIYVLDFSLEVSDGHFRKCSEDISGNVERTLQDVSREHTNNTEFNKTEISETDSFLFSSKSEGCCDDEGTRSEEKRNESDNYDAIRGFVKNKIGYEVLKHDYPDNAVVDEIYEVIVDVISSNRKEILITGERKSMSIVKSQFMKLTMFHVVYAMDCLERNTTQIKNMKQYLLAVLYNSFMTMDSHYKSMALHDMAYRTNEGGLGNE